MKKYILTYFVILISSYFSFAQKAKSPKPTANKVTKSNSLNKKEGTNLQLIAKVKADKVMLRWFPLSKSVWTQGVLNGYNIERISANGQKTLLNTSPIKSNFDSLTISTDTTKSQELPLLAVAKYLAEKNTISSQELENLYTAFVLGIVYNYQKAKNANYTFDDNYYDKNETYTYRISLANNPKINSSFDVNTRILTSYKAINNLKGKMIKNSVDLTWNENELNKDYVTFNIERSLNEMPYEIRNKNPYSKTSDDTTGIIKFGEKIDMVGVVGKYRIRGVDYFGEQSEPSNEIKVVTIPENMPLCDNIRGEMDTKLNVKLSWSFPSEFEKYIQNFSISQSDDPIDGFKIAKDNISSNLRNTNFIAMSNAVYVKVNYTDIRGDLQISYPILIQSVDTIPPLPPLGLKGNINKSGLLTLNWDKNTEKDLQGYHVYAANDSLSEPTKITDNLILKNEFTDTVAVKNVLNKNLYYYLTAIDKRGNYSNYSKVCKVNRPDLVAPSKPNFLDYDISENNIKLKWVNSTDGDVAKTILKRRTMDENEWVSLINFTPKNNIIEFVDSTVKSKTKYIYDLFVEDFSGNISQSYTPLLLESAMQPIKIDFSEFSAVYDTENEIIQLNWKTKNPELIKQFIILRGYNTEPISTWRVIDSTENSIIDNQIHKDQTIIYIIQAKLNAGYVSPTSKTFSIRM